MFVLDETVRAGGGVAEIAQHRFDVGHSRTRMSTARVRPHTGPRELAQGPPCHEDATSGVAQIYRERAMSRRVAVMYGRPCRLSDNLSFLVHKLDQVFVPNSGCSYHGAGLLADDRNSVGQTLYKR